MTKIKTELRPVPLGAKIMLDGKEWHEQEPLKLRPKERQGYTVLNIYGSLTYTSFGGLDDKRIWNQGNGFLLEADAIREGERQVLEKQLLDRIKTLNHREGWKPDFDDNKQMKKYFNYYTPNSKDFKVTHTWVVQARPAAHYFKPELEDEIRKQFSHQQLHFIYNGVRDE
jgi:hypothetical protein